MREIKIYNFLITKATPKRSLWKIETISECKACFEVKEKRRRHKEGDKNQWNDDKTHEQT